MNDIIKKSASNFDNHHVSTLFYHSAREGMQDLLREILNDPTQSILLPAFIGWSPREGSGVFDPVKALKIKATFYSLNPDLTVNLSLLEAALIKNRPKVLVLIHYYGRTDTNMKAVKEISERYNVILIEDLAHGFYSAFIGGVAGQFGAVSLFSLHKMFPLQDGGMITYRDESLLRNQVETYPELARQILNYDWAAIASRRRYNFQEISQRLQEIPECGVDFELLWPDLAPHDVPQTLPLRIISHDRDQIYHSMNAAGYGVVSLYHTLIEEVRHDFPEMGRLSNSILNLPVHQDVDIRHLDGLVKTFRDALHLS